MVNVLAKWVASRRVEIAADSAYCNDTATRGLPGNSVLVGAMRPNAVLTAAPPTCVRNGGRPPKRGRVRLRRSAPGTRTSAALCFAEVLGAAQRVLAPFDGLDPRRSLANLRSCHSPTIRSANAGSGVTTHSATGRQR